MAKRTRKPQWMLDGKAFAEMQAEMRKAEMETNAMKLQVALDNGWNGRANALMERMTNG